jgi:hypothetical protein
MSEPSPISARAGLTGMVLVSVLWANAALADDGLTVDLSARLFHDSNPDLLPQGSPSETTGALDLSFGLIQETEVSTLALQGSLGLLDTENSPASDPSLALTYDRLGANADFHVDAALQQSDVTSTTDITNFETGQGQRRVADLNAALNLNTSRPLGFGLTAGVSDISYHDNPSPDLIDSRTLDLGTTLRADLSTVLHATLGLSISRFTQDGQPDRDTTGYSAGLVLDRPTGPLSLQLLVEDTPDGQRERLGFDQQSDAPVFGGQLGYGLGVTRGVSGKTYLDGALHYGRDLPRGALRVDLTRDVTSGAETDSETVQSRASLGVSQEVTANSSLALAVDWAEQRDTLTGQTDANTTLSATWSQELTADWALDLGYSHLVRDQDEIGRGQSDQVSLALRRSFSLRF